MKQDMVKSLGMVNNSVSNYEAKKSFFDSITTIYGRNPVMEALSDNSINIHKLHLSTSNKPSSQIEEMVYLAKKRDVEIAYHDKLALSRISKNAKQDQGVALDIVMSHSNSLETFLTNHKKYRIIALDGITNPQNLGMIIRSCSAGDIDAIILPTSSSVQISPLVIKASAGTLFKLPIIKSKRLYQSLQTLKNDGAMLYTLDSNAPKSYKEQHYGQKCIFILGNESNGVSKEIENLSDISISIPMKRGVESLNVAVTASLLAFM